MQFRTTSQHAIEICELLHQQGDYEFGSVYNWLFACASIKNVEVDTIQFDKGFGYCEHADHYSMSQEDLLHPFITDLTRFLFAWGALEALIDEINPPAAPQHGKINRICWYLKNQSPNDSGFSGYCESLSELKHCLTHHQVDDRETLARFVLAPHVSFRGAGMYVVYKIRNRLAHGSQDFPQPDEDHEPNSLLIPMIQTAARLVLISIQHVLDAAIEGADLRWTEFIEGEEVERCWNEKVRTCHLMSPTEEDLAKGAIANDPNQLEFAF